MAVTEENIKPKANGGKLNIVNMSMLLIAMQNYYPHQDAMGTLLEF